MWAATDTSHRSRPLSETLACATMFSLLTIARRSCPSFTLVLAWLNKVTLADTFRPEKGHCCTGMD